jgi:hypothetical protein
MYTYPSASPLLIDVPWCVTVAEIAWDGQYVPVDAGPAGPDGCSSPPTYTGLPYGSSQRTAPPTIATSGAVPAVSITVSSTVTVPDFSNAAAPAPPSSAAPVPSSSATPSSVAVPISQASGKLITPTARRAHVVT